MWEVKRRGLGPACGQRGGGKGPLRMMLRFPACLKRGSVPEASPPSLGSTPSPSLLEAGPGLRVIPGDYSPLRKPGQACLLSCGRAGLGGRPERPSLHRRVCPAAVSPTESFRQRASLRPVPSALCPLGRPPPHRPICQRLTCFSWGASPILSAPSYPLILRPQLSRDVPSSVKPSLAASLGVAPLLGPPIAARPLWVGPVCVQPCVPATEV